MDSPESRLPGKFHRAWRPVPDRQASGDDACDHFEGALEISHLPNTFVSVEITTYFPEDGCKIHVLALNITEGQHADIQAIRENSYVLVDYLAEAGIIHIVAHPLYSVNGKLTIAHVEKLPHHGSPGLRRSDSRHRS